MALQVRSDQGGKGTTVPYPPLYDDIRRNHGFVDLRGKPELVREVLEAAESGALFRLLIALSQPRSQVCSLGCDLGTHVNSAARWGTRQVAGGYVQIADSRFENFEFNIVKDVSVYIEKSLRANVGNDRWDVKFELRSVIFNFNAPVEAPSVWLWFFAKHSSRTGAIESRERLMNCVAEALEKFSEE